MYKIYQIGWISGLFAGMFLGFMLSMLLASFDVPVWTYFIFAVIGILRWLHYSLRHDEEIARIHGWITEDNE